MATWAERIESGVKPVQLHYERFKVWHDFIDYFIDEFNKNSENPLEKNIYARSPSSSNEFELSVVARGNAFSKIILSSDNKILYIFDAAFGSLDPTSDLDVMVDAIDTRVLDAWIVFLKQNRVKDYTFSSYYDSNFYFEPAIYEDNNLTSMVKKYRMDALSTKETMKEDMERIEVYAKAYINKKSLILDKFQVFPNPMSPEFNQEAEINQYEAMKYYANKCFKKYSVKSAAELASTKSEGLLSVGSLAICGVFGKEIQSNFISGDIKNEAWRLVAAFEMLYNLKMHRHKDDNGNEIIKSKYLSRLNNALLNSSFTCSGEFRKKTTEAINNNKNMHKNIKENKIIHLINAVVEDEVNGEKCPMKKDGLTSLDKDIEKIKNVIVSRSLKVARYHQYNMIKQFKPL